MIFIEHRINTKAQLAKVSPEHGMEVDIRTANGKLVIHHDPFQAGEDFESWLLAAKEFGIRGPLVFNTKEDGLENAILELCEKHRIANFFFLDTTIPTLVKFSLHKGERRFACRISAYEPLESLRAFENKVEWVWFDCFGGQPLALEALLDVKRRNFKVCLVSPELQGTQEMNPVFEQLKVHADAVCTKDPARWARASDPRHQGASI